MGGNSEQGFALQRISSEEGNGLLINSEWEYALQRISVKREMAL